MQYFVASLLLVHVGACTFIYIGYLDKTVEDETLRTSWLTVPDNEFADTSWHYIYSFAYYWIFETMSTVGFGEFSGSTVIEWWFTVCIEFLGVTFVAMLLGFMGKAIGQDVSFDGFITSRMDAIDTWVLKLEKSNKPKFLSPSLYSGITNNVENAMMFDYNLIIEEFEFYQRLTPRMQTELIDEIFIDF